VLKCKKRGGLKTLKKQDLPRWGSPSLPNCQFSLSTNQRLVKVLKNQRLQQISQTKQQFANFIQLLFFHFLFIKHLGDFFDLQASQDQHNSVQLRGMHHDEALKPSGGKQKWRWLVATHISILQRPFPPVGDLK